METKGRGETYQGDIMVLGWWYRHSYLKVVGFLAYDTKRTEWTEEEVKNAIKWVIRVRNYRKINRHRRRLLAYDYLRYDRDTKTYTPGTETAWVVDALKTIPPGKITTIKQLWYEIKKALTGS